jgi:hypothetical protein
MPLHEEDTHSRSNPEEQKIKKIKGALQVILKETSYAPKMMEVKSKDHPGIHVG